MRISGELVSTGEIKRYRSLEDLHQQRFTDWIDVDTTEAWHSEDPHEVQWLFQSSIVITTSPSACCRRQPKSSRGSVCCRRGARKLYKARSPLYRSQWLQPNIRWKRLAEIYTIHAFAPLSNLSFFCKKFARILPKIAIFPEINLTKIADFCWILTKFCRNFAGISPKFAVFLTLNLFYTFRRRKKVFRLSWVPRSIGKTVPQEKLFRLSLDNRRKGL